MSDSSKPTRAIGWVFLFAMRRESKPFLRGRWITARFPDAPCRACAFEVGRDDALVLESGMGFQCAKKAIDWVLARFDPRLVVACGFAGALDPSLDVGDVIVASEVVEPEDQIWRVALPMELGDCELGRLVTTATVASRPAAKRQLARSHRAIAVDMESAAIAEACQEAGVSCAAVRSISDTADTTLSPPLERLLNGGEVSVSRALAALVRHPSLAVEFFRLARDTRRAAESLANALNRLLPNTH